MDGQKQTDTQGTHRPRSTTTKHSHSARRQSNSKIEPAANKRSAAFVPWVGAREWGIRMDTDGGWGE